MQEMFHEMIKYWFHLVENWGYAGVFVLMALESSIVPVPSEIVMPPAAFWASQGKMNFWGVVLAGTAGSYAGSIISYLIARALGRPFVNRYGKYFFFSEAKIQMTEKWIHDFGNMGIFFARLLPVIRHLISIPAGIFKMKVVPFSIYTTIGAFLWCLVLSYFGKEVIGSSPELLTSPEMMIKVLKDKMHHIVIGILVLMLAYSFVVWFKKRGNKNENKKNHQSNLNL